MTADLILEDEASFIASDKNLTLLEIHSDTFDGDLTFSDSSPFNRTVTGNGGIENSTLWSAVGASSVHPVAVDFNYLIVPSAPELSLNADEFTISLYARWSNFVSFPTLIGKWFDTANFLQDWNIFPFNGDLYFTYTLDGKTTTRVNLVFPVSLSVNIGYKIDFVRVNDPGGDDKLYLFVDNIQQGAGQVLNDTIFSGTYPMIIMGGPRPVVNSNYQMDGFTDEIFIYNYPIIPVP